MKTRDGYDTRRVNFRGVSHRTARHGPCGHAHWCIGRVSQWRIGAGFP